MSSEQARFKGKAGVWLGLALGVLRERQLIDFEAWPDGVPFDRLSSSSLEAMLAPTNAADLALSAAEHLSREVVAKVWHVFRCLGREDTFAALNRAAEAADLVAELAEVGRFPAQFAGGHHSLWTGPEAVKRDARRGHKTLRSAQQGHEAAHGTGTEKATRWADLQSLLEDHMRAHPSHSLTQSRQHVAKLNGVGYSTMRRHTRRPS